MLAKTVDHQFTTTQEVADAVLFFVVYPSLVITGQSLLVSHGQNMS
jgi:3-hydroxybutyrate dehydrogenase